MHISQPTERDIPSHSQYPNPADFLPLPLASANEGPSRHLHLGLDLHHTQRHPISCFLCLYLASAVPFPHQPALGLCRMWTEGAFWHGEAPRFYVLDGPHATSLGVGPAAPGCPSPITR